MSVNPPNAIGFLERSLTPFIIQDEGTNVPTDGSASKSICALQWKVSSSPNNVYLWDLSYTLVKRNKLWIHTKCTSSTNCLDFAGRKVSILASLLFEFSTQHNLCKISSTSSFLRACRREGSSSDPRSDHNLRSQNSSAMLNINREETMCVENPFDKLQGCRHCPLCSRIWQSFENLLVAFCCC